MENDWKTATSLIQSGSHLGARSSEVLHLPVVTLTQQHVCLCVQAHLFPGEDSNHVCMC